MDELLVKLTNETKRKSVKRKCAVANVQCNVRESQDEVHLIKLFQNYVNTANEPEKKLLKFKAAERLGSRSSGSNILKISNLFPEEVAEGALCLLKRIQEWSTSSASNDRKDNLSSYGAGSIEHQFHASSCLQDHPYKRDFERFYEIIASLLPNKAHYAFQAGKYTQGHFIDAHDDAAYLDVPFVDADSHGEDTTTLLCSRDTAMVYYLTKNWSSDNGGSFIDLVGGEVIMPEFNTCILFHVPRLHRVEPVLKMCERFSVFGWFYERGRLYELNHAEKSQGVDSDSRSGNKKSKKRRKKGVRPSLEMQERTKVV